MIIHDFVKILVLVAVVLGPCNLYAAPDFYRGDTSIYGGIVTTVQPNILIILDNSGSMTNSVPSAKAAYDPNTTYTPLRYCNGSYCSANAVYKASDYSKVLNNVDSVTCNGTTARDQLKTSGQYSGTSLTVSGACGSKTGSYVLGNYVNWLKIPSTIYRPKIDIARDVVTNLIQTTNGVNFGLMKFNQEEGGTLIKQNVSGVDYITSIKNMDDIHTGTTTNRQALINVVSGYTASTWTPLAETLYEAMLYYKGGTAKFGSAGLTDGKYTTPIQASCQQNYIILVTDGMSTRDKNAILGSEIGDFDGDGADPGSFADSGSHYLDDVAKYLYDKDLLPDDSAKPYTIGTQNVKTFTIGFGLSGADADAVTLLQRTADSSHGHGEAHVVADQAGLSEALAKVVSNILETNSSFVAPVVPVSPENKTANASRMYIGLFKPALTAFWAGNLKKYGLDSANYLTDKDGDYANYVDLDGNGFEDRPPYNSLPNGKRNGSFRDDSRSFWSVEDDASDVGSGGVGQLLQMRTPSDRKIYTYFGNAALTDGTNVFDTSNTSITAALLGVADTAAKDNLIKFVRGIDVYDDNKNDSTTDNRDWVMGDVLHSKPTVVNYKKYAFTSENEADCAKNKTMIYVGANDGMLHAFRDCDGSEAWAFIPPAVLPNLRFSTGETHTNFLDSTVSAYVYDEPTKDHKLGDGDADGVYLIVGQRRGGGSNAVPATGFYYLLDATDPESPKYIKSFSNATAGFTELGETWSEPNIAKIKVDSQYRIAAIFGSGYDNLNEDSRYGATQLCSGTGGVTNSDSGAGFLTSGGSSTALNPKGRGVYIVEIARLTSGDNGYTSEFTHAGERIWSYTNNEDSDLKYSISGEIATVDTKGKGYIDRLYATDSAGNLWRFNIGASSVSGWTGLKVFTPNPDSSGATDIGRKAFYKPAVVLDYCHNPLTNKMVTCDMVFYGTGDREHPLNTKVVDRMYMIKVKDIDTVGKTESCTSGETDPSKCLIDVTDDQLQTTQTANTSSDPDDPTTGSVEYILKQLKNSGGWYIKLNVNAGEKVLSSPRVLNKVAYFTTYVPTSSDPCQIANPGDGYVYELDYKTGEAAFNLVTTNDTANASTRVTTNTRGQSKGSNLVLDKRDRKRVIGRGIPSGVVLVGDKIFVSSGGDIVQVPGGKGLKGKVLYWRHK